jgi:cephalosporin-C deacetylase-like acetyl esterase
MKRFLGSLLFAVMAVCSAAAQVPTHSYIEFLLTPDHADWVYRTGEKATVKVQLFRYGIPVEADIAYRIGPEMMPPTETGTLSTKGGPATLNLGTMNEPGFRVANVSVEFEGRRYDDQVKVGFSPEKIRPTVTLPDDFARFWEGAVAANAGLPMDPIVTPMPEASTRTVDVYLVSLQNHRRGERMYGYLCVPKAPGKYPVLMSPPGAGVRRGIPSTTYADNGFISFSYEIHGIDPRLDAATYSDIARALGSYQTNNMDDRDTYYYKKVYLGCVRAIDYLVSHPQFDGKNVMVTGGSQGGALTMVTAGLHPRVTALAAFYPALCDIEGYLHGRAGGWPHMFNEAGRAVNATPEKINTVRYYDVVNFARRIKAPGWYCWGFNDNVCPPTSTYSALNVITAPVETEITPNVGHWRYRESDQNSIAWLKAQVK